MRTTSSLVLSCFLLAACGKDEPSPPATGGGSGIYTTFYPTTYFAERVAGDLVPVTCPVPDDADPIFWKPTREALASYQSAALVITNGASFEKWLETANLPPSRIVDAGKEFADELLRYEDAVVHRHGPGGEHSHEGIDGHTWLDPLYAKAQAAAISEALAARWPEHATAFATNLTALQAELDALHARFGEIKPPALLASHPAYNYPARRYGWDIDNLDLDPETMPSDAQLADLRERLAKRPVTLLLWESAPLPEIAARLQTEFGLRSIEFSPCEAAPEDGEDYLSVMKDNLDRLAESL